VASDGERWRADYSSLAAPRATNHRDASLQC